MARSPTFNQLSVERFCETANGKSTSIFARQCCCTMSSFSIQDLLGLRGKDADHKTDAGKSTPAHDDHAAAEDDVNENSETVHEEDVYNAAHQLVTVEVRTLHSSSTVSRSSSRKRKKREQAKEREPTPDTDDDHDEQETSTSPECHSNDVNAKADHDSRSSIKRLRTAFSTPQLRALEYFFRVCPYPDSYGREQIAKATGIDEAKIQVWFQNRRARYRKREKPLEPQKSPAGQGPSPSPSPVSPHSMMQAFFTAAALSSANCTPATAATPSPPHFYHTPGGPFFAAGFAAFPPYPPFLTYSTPSMAAAQLHAQQHAHHHAQATHQTAKDS